MSSLPESGDAFSFRITNSLRGLLCLGIFVFHFCYFFPTQVKPDIGYTLVGAFFMLSGFGLLESFKRKENYLDEFVGKKTARLLVPVWIAGIIVLTINFLLFNNASILNEQAYLFDIISGGVMTTRTWFVIELIIFYLFFYLAFKHLSIRLGIVAVSLAVTLMMILLSQQEHNMWYSSGMMFPVGLILSYYRDRIESIKPYTILMIAVIVSLILAHNMIIFKSHWYSGLLLGNVQCLLVSMMIVMFLLARKNGVGVWLAALLLCNFSYCVIGLVLGLGLDQITAVPVITALVIPASIDIVSPLTNLLGNISYEFYIIHVTMLHVSRIWFAEMLSCFISSLILTLVMAIVINRVSKIFFDDKKKDASLKSG